jgi:hypothetical protein
MQLFNTEIYQGKVFNTNHHTTDDLEDAIEQKGVSISTDTLQDHFTGRRTHQTCFTLRTVFPTCTIILNAKRIKFLQGVSIL